jgi:hypothetical protein
MNSVTREINNKVDFLGGPNSRWYGRTAALRLLVQPYEEEEKDDFFFIFPSNGAPVE